MIYKVNRQQGIVVINTQPIMRNIAVIDGEHFYTEWPALVCVYKWIKGRLEELGYKNNVYISKCNKSPYKYK